MKYKITRKELRRAYKLCYDQQLPQEILSIAKMTFVFLKINIEEEVATTFKKVEAPWDSPNWSQALKKRKVLRNANQDTQGKIDWRKRICIFFEKEHSVRTHS